MKINPHIDQFDTMYPSASWMLNSQQWTLPDHCKYATIYGYSFGTSDLDIDGVNYKLSKGQYFALPVKNKATATAWDSLFLVTRLGYQAMPTMGWVEGKGRLSYIDGCSDSLLVYPARLGDSSLNLLYFPPGIEQSFHRHPSIRLGCVIAGEGLSSHGDYNNISEDSLVPGTSFCLEEQERHRFRTEKSSMTIIAFHPDGDWGPTDHNHTMLNRTYLDK
jgi:quercetin dioxygenase-like cupin family protein